MEASELRFPVASAARGSVEMGSLILMIESSCDPWREESWERISSMLGVIMVFGVVVGLV